MVHFIILYVDDMLIIETAERVAQIKKAISQHFDIIMLGLATHFLGMVVKCNRESGQIYLNQTGYIVPMLERFGLRDCHGTAMPMDPKVKLSYFNKDTNTTFDQQQYRKAIGSLGGLLEPHAQISPMLCQCLEDSLRS
jgi:hypothetical protein